MTETGPIAAIRHNEAIARVIRGAAPLDQASINIANAIRTTKDPAALDALESALIRAGRLVIRDRKREDGRTIYITDPAPPEVSR